MPTSQSNNRAKNGTVRNFSRFFLASSRHYFTALPNLAQLCAKQTVDWNVTSLKALHWVCQWLLSLWHHTGNYWKSHNFIYYLYLPQSTCTFPLSTFTFGVLDSMHGYSMKKIAVFYHQSQRNDCGVENHNNARYYVVRTTRTSSII